mmetsp:Transcript_39399/g.108553  ORF Transcript_39399/g.108553 Transcript_39399/m.108553 type:complete len:235 (+) Transcript_39399:150-854(+)
MVRDTHAMRLRPRASLEDDVFSGHIFEPCAKRRPHLCLSLDSFAPQLLQRLRRRCPLHHIRHVCNCNLILSFLALLGCITLLSSCSQLQLSTHLCKVDGWAHRARLIALHRVFDRTRLQNLPTQLCEARSRPIGWQALPSGMLRGAKRPQIGSDIHAHLIGKCRLHYHLAKVRTLKLVSLTGPEWPRWKRLHKLRTPWLRRSIPMACRHLAGRRPLSACSCSGHQYISSPLARI